MTSQPIAVEHLMTRPLEGFGGPARLTIEAGMIAAVEALDTPGDGAGLVAMPAPANAHDHGRGLRPLAFGAVDDTLELWVPALAQEPVVDPYLRAAVAFARLAEGGVGATNHCHGTQDRDGFLREAEAVSKAARDVGVRVAFAAPIMNRNPTVYGDLDAVFSRLDPADAGAIRAGMRPFRSLQESLDLVEAAAQFEHAHFQVQYHPIAPQWVDDATMAAIAELSARTGRRIHTHLFETRRQREWADVAYPGGLIAHLDQLGLLSPRLSLAHGVWLRPGECELLAERGVILSVNPSSNLRLRSGVPATGACHAAGLPMAVGLDGMAFDDDEDMLREARLFWRMARGFGDDDGVTAPQMFDALCRVGRRSVLGDDGGGVIAPGAPADLLVLDAAAMLADSIGIDPPTMDIVTSRMTKRHIRALVVAGREIVRDSRCVSVDLPAMEQALHDEARKAAGGFDRGRLVRLQGAITDFYRCGCHLDPAGGPHAS